MADILPTFDTRRSADHIRVGKLVNIMPVVLFLAMLCAAFVGTSSRVSSLSLSWRIKKKGAN